MFIILLSIKLIAAFSSYQAAGNHIEVVTLDVLCRR